MERLRCVVERITYQNAENGYTVLRCAAQKGADLVTVVGTMPDTHVGSVLSLEGFWKVDAKYGRQFCVERFEETLPATVYGIEKYLGSGLVKGIGPKFARRIVQAFGEDTLDVIENHPEKLLEVPGIGTVRVERVKKSWEEQKEIKNIMLFLQSHEVSTAHATKIFKTYGADSIAVVRENPYRLADDIWGIGFQTADTIARKLGFDNESAVRLRSGLSYTLNRLAESGHCYAEREQLIQTAQKLLEAQPDKLEAALDDMLRAGDVVREEEAIYLHPFYFAETGCARLLLRLLEAERRVWIDVPTVMRRMQEGGGIVYDEVQREAIRVALSSKVMILTGGPGTGKTTTTMGIIEACRAAGCDIVLAAPTGRAAKRLSETTGMEAKTIHRLLEYKPPDGYQKNEEAPLEGDVLILDESSMIDVMLMYNLLKAVPAHMALILVGDTDQLPSVGAGNVLGDMIASGRFPVVRLMRIFRQAQGSRIILNAHRINKGQPIDMRGGKDSDFFFVSRETNEETAALLVQYVRQNLPRYYHVNAVKDIQVLTPMQRGVCGATNLNQLLQQALNPNACCLQRGGVQYRLHDKVMQVRNNYDKEVFNGDIGTISRVDTEERELTVEFDGRDVVYDVTELGELVLAYAITIHKSQGSEFPIVVMPFTMSHYVMLQRNLLYTGVTRAKKILVLIGEKRAVSCAIQKETATDRNTRLAQRLAADVDTAEQNDGRSDDMPAPVADAYEGLFRRLARSAFRSRFCLRESDRSYVREKGMDTIRRHAHELIEKRLAPAQPVNDGKQTPMRGHPVFIAQHATATCCRGCLEKWHNIPQGRELSQQEQEYVVDVILTWLKRQGCE